MIDFETEELLTVTEATRVAPFVKNGKPAHISTVYKAFNKGLESLRTPRGIFTSRQAIKRFIAKLNGVQVTGRSSKQREREIVAAERKLVEAGCL